jgi:cytochrome c
VLRLIALSILLATAVQPSFAQDQATGSDISSRGNADNGQRVFNRCKACHNLTASTRTRLGPNLDGLFGRPAGKEVNYKYSRALADANFDWTEEKLNEWLVKPSAFLPGNKMAFAGVRKEQERNDLIAYLRRATETKPE